MNSAMRKGNGNIRACLIFVLVVILWILAISEFAPIKPTMDNLCKNHPTIKQCPDKEIGGAL